MLYLLAGRKIGQVEKLFSPVSKEDAAQAEEAANAIHGAPSPPAAGTPPKPKYEARIDVRVDKTAFVYKDARARLITLGLLGETAIDITQGNESSGRAEDGQTYAGERVPDFSLRDQNGQTRTLASVMGPKGLMLVFYRSADW